MIPGITVVIPTIPERVQMVQRALASVHNQTLQPAAILVIADQVGAGAAVTRSRGLAMADTEWTAFLDDDDEFYGHHLRSLMMHAETTGADLVFPWFDVVGGADPFPANEHREFDIEHPHQTTVTFLVRTEAARQVGGFTNDELPGYPDPVDEQGHRAGEEFRFVIALALAGYKIAHLDQRTWRWNHHGANTSGRPSQQKGALVPLPVDTSGSVGYATY